MRTALCIIAMLCLGASISQGQSKGSLYGWMVILDPGHGGTDPGSSRIHGGNLVTEDEYVYDVSLRVARMIRERGGLAFLTIKDIVGERSNPANQIFPHARTERFSLDGTLVRAGATGLSKRVKFGNSKSRQYPKHRQAWISVHFDVVGRLTSVNGIRIICVSDKTGLVKELESSFKNAGRLRDKNPVVRTGDPTYGIRELYVLRSHNKIKDRVLIELGNFRNDRDVWRIRSPVVREAYARAIIKALEDN